MNQAKAPFWVSHPINTSISSVNIINAKQGFEGSLISRNVELSPQKPLKWSSDLQGWSVAEQYIDRARSESRLTTMTSFETKFEKGLNVIYLKRSGCLNPSLAGISSYLFIYLSDSLSSTTSSLPFWGNTIHRPPIVTHSPHRPRSLSPKKLGIQSSACRA